ncbi:MAG: AMP-binding protein [Algicola sp.]|nr:AMP-binding protein [Algicola sp.]
MNNLLETLNAVWQHQPKKAMLVDGDTGLNHVEFLIELEKCKQQLMFWQPKSVALLADNSVQWVLVDLACQLLNIPFLPLPVYFTPKQLKHSIIDAGCDLLLIENAMGDASTLDSLLQDLAGGKVLGELNQYGAFALQGNKAQLPEHTAKITFTSGSTGQPKGVCLSNTHQWQVASSIKARINKRTNRHLCILPLATLLENVAGVYAALLNGTTVVIPRLSELGFNGSSSLDFAKLLDQISQCQPSSLITTPEILAGLTAAAEQGWTVPECLSFVPVGGARVAPGLINRAHKAGIAVYQGYGLSECGSVVSLNAPSQANHDTMGRVLTHNTVTIEEGEVMVSGDCFLGYANQPDSWGQSKCATGDMGFIDDKGYLTITGRRKNLLISSYGRNINPEWVESELLASSLLKQAFVFGDGKPYCVAALSAVNANINSTQIDQWISQVNAQLPDYAQIKAWFLVLQPILPGSSLLTSNGRPKRAPLLDFFQNQINQHYNTI